MRNSHSLGDAICTEILLVVCYLVHAIRDVWSTRMMWYTSILWLLCYKWFPEHLILGRYKLYHHITTTHTAMIQYTVDNNKNDVVIYWTMTGTNVAPDRQQYIGLREVHTLYRIDISMIGTHQLHLANADMIPGVVPDRQQYDRHTPITSCKRKYDTWCKYFILNRSFNEYSTTSRQPSIRADSSS